MVCPHCGSGQLDWITPSGKGTVYSTTVVRRKPEHGGAYNVALVDLEEGVRMMSRVDGIAPDAVAIGMAVQASVVDAGDGKLVVFTQPGGRACSTPTCAAPPRPPSVSMPGWEEHHADTEKG